MNEKRDIKNSIGFLSAIVVFISLLGKVFGFLREVLLAKYFGTSLIVDVYLMSYTIPAILFGALPALGVGFTPIYFRINGRKDQNSFLTKAMLLSCVVALLCILVTYAFDNQIVNICASGFPKTAKKQTISFLRITIWTIVFNTPIQLLIAYLNCKKNYFHSSLSGLTISITNVLFIMLASYFGSTLLPWGYLVPYVIQFIWLFLASLKIGYKPIVKEDKQDNLKQLLVLSLPICLSNMLIDINGFVDKTLSSYLQEGSLSSLNYAFTLRAAIVTIFQALISTIYYPSLSELFVKKNITSYNVLLKKILSTTTIIIIPINVLSILLPKEIIQVIMMRGNFNYKSLELTVGPFVMYMFSLTFIIIRELFIRIMYISNESKDNLIYGTINVLINIGLSIALVNRLHHIGLALATSIAAIVTFPFYILKIKKIIPSLSFKYIFVDVVKIMISSSVMGGAVLFLKSLVGMNITDGFFCKIVKMLLYLVGGSCMYVTMLRILRVEKTVSAIKMLNNRISK